MLETTVSFSRCLSILVTHISQTNLQLATNLDFWQKQYDIRDDVPGQTLDLLDGVDLGALSFQESVLDNARVNTRAGLYVYLNAMVINAKTNPYDELRVLTFSALWTSVI